MSKKLEMKKFQKEKRCYITTTLPYVNGAVHVGFAMEIIRADVIARHKRILLGDENVFFNTGTDEHGQKLYDESKKLKMNTQEYVDKMSKNFKNILKPLNISNNKFIRTTDEEHKKSAQKFWIMCHKAGFIYKKNYQCKYCVGCELEKQDSELINGKCSQHLNKKIELKDEENYFFAWSKFSKKLIEYLKTNPVIPSFRQNEIKNFIQNGLEDFSISRIKKKMKWGISVPEDDNHVIYVWFDALINYISTLGWGSNNEENFEKFWNTKDSEVIQFCGKDNLRQQSAMWQAMLMSVGIKNSDKIFINGFININGKKMSKSSGDIITAKEIVEKYGTDALRYFVIRHFNNHEDSDFSWQRFSQNYQADLVNGLGNLTNRILSMSERANIKLFNQGRGYPIFKRGNSKLENYDFNGEANDIWKLIGDLDRLITKTEPFKLIKEEPKKAKIIILSLLNSLWALADWIYPIMPDTSEKIKEGIKLNKKPHNPIFPKIIFSN